MGHSHEHDEVHLPSYGEYVVGFVLSVVLTCIAFAAVVYHWFTPIPTFLFIFGLAILQMTVQILYFLHLGQGPDSRWNYGMLLFSAVVLVIIIGGTAWTIFNLMNNAMDWSPADQPPPLVELYNSDLQ